MVTGGQIRAARALLGWSQETLGQTAGVAVRTIRFFEADARRPHARTLDLLEVALMGAGIVFLSTDAGTGVLLKVVAVRD